MKNFKILFAIVSKGRDHRNLWIIGIIVLMAIAEVAGIAAVIPFLSVISDPEELNAGWMRQARDFWGYDSQTDAVVALGVATIVVLVVSSIVRALSVLAINYATQLYLRDVSRILVNDLLRRNLIYFKNKPISDLTGSLLAVALQMVNVTARPALRLLSSTVVAIFIVGFLVIIDPIIAITGLLILSACYALIFASLYRVNGRLGSAILNAQLERQRLVSQMLQGIKFVKLRGVENAYSAEFDRQTRMFARAQAMMSTLSQLPRYAVETIAFATLVLSGIYVFLMDYEAEARAALLPLIGAYALGGYRLLPVLQAGYQALSELRAGSPSVTHILSMLKDRNDIDESFDSPRTPELPFNSEIQLRNVTYKYPGARNSGVEGVKLTIKRGKILAIVGQTGSGKSTLVDLIIGVLQPTGGEIEIDGVLLDASNTRRWQCQIGYVPQDIFLFDGTIRENVAFATPGSRSEIDDSRVQWALKLAALADFVANELPKGVHTSIGENGAQLSGGQRQRIGIARALYQQPKLIVFDEATSALDQETEREIISSITGPDLNSTVVMITHRVVSVSNADVVAIMEKGRIKASGSYDEVVASMSSGDTANSSSKGI